MTKKTDIKNDKAAAQAESGPQDVPQKLVKSEHGPDRESPDPHGGNQGRHGSGEGLTGMQPGAGHPRGR